ncbi:MAG: catalase family protein [Coleofasciculaceae cyanobacterium]
MIAPSPYSDKLQLYKPYKSNPNIMAEAPLELGKEYPPQEEEALIEQILTISKLSMQHKPHPPMLRDQHPKSHGCVQGEFIVEEDIPETMKVGVFKESKTYPIWIRFSNGGSDRDPKTGDFVPDTVGDVRGMAIKLINVEGEMVLPEPEHKGEQDFVLMNNPTFFIRDVQGYIDFFPVVRAIKEGKIIFKPGEPPQVPADLQANFQAVAYAFPMLQKIRAKLTTSPLEIPYWSATPYKLGNQAIKFSVVPHATGERFNPENAADKSNYLREAMTQHFASQDAYFDLKIQLQTDAVKMPVEDPTVEWDEQESPYVKVATIKVSSQNFNTEERKYFDEKQSFSPWHTLPEHQPLGGVNRARKRVYGELAKFRNDRNQSDRLG